MRTLQRPARGAVIEFASRPEHGVVAGRALRYREARLDMIRHRSTERLRAQPGRLMAYRAIRWCRQFVVVAHVAERISAGDDFTGRHQLVRACQRPARGAVIKACGGPRNGVVASRAVRGGKWSAG